VLVLVFESACLLLIALGVMYLSSSVLEIAIQSVSMFVCAVAIVLVLVLVMLRPQE